MSFELFGFSLHLYGFILGTALVVSLSITEYLLKKEKVPIDVMTMALFVIPIGVVGARLYHLITDWSLYTNATFIELLAIWNGGLGIIGGFIAGGIALFSLLYYFHQLKYLFHILDALALSIPFGQAIGRWGNFVNQELYGVPTTLPWGIQIDQKNLSAGFLQADELRFHPLFFYESMLMLGVGAIFWLIYLKKVLPITFGAGKFFGMYCISYGAIRFSLEFLRIETARMEGFLELFSTAQWMSLSFILIGAILLFSRLGNTFYAASHP